MTGSILSELPPTGPELRSLPDEASPYDRETLLRFAQDLQSPEYRQAMLMALSGAAGAPQVATGKSGALSRLSDALLGTQEQRAAMKASEAAYKARFSPEEWAALMQEWEKYNVPASLDDIAASAEATRAQGAPIQGILNALKFSLGLDLPKTAAMAGR